MSDQTPPEPYSYADSDGYYLSARLLFGDPDTLSVTVEGDDPQSAHIPLAQVAEVAAGILRAAGLPTATEERAAAAPQSGREQEIRAAARSEQEENARLRVQLQEARRALDLACQGSGAAVRRALEDFASRLTARAAPMGAEYFRVDQVADAARRIAAEEHGPAAAAREQGEVQPDEGLPAQLARVTAERDELLTELDGRDAEARERWIQKSLDETRIRSMEFRNGAEMQIEPARELLAHWVAAARAVLGDAPNYSETVAMDVKVAESPARYSLVVQRLAPRALTPHEARQRAEADLSSVLRIVSAWAASSEGRDVLIEDLAAAGHPLPDEKTEPTA
ncbi:hypothetical protein [Streptomyces sp. 8L]|uniref:hypothetical protein n=1 Tax=Streptomyces sp. 8L TaxID=2877242 RepID=UPI001CD31185|nr:hypothetical protein [Streptomyces sp. 8L]MCA1218673.1 hypothetical protein [Streptomyces sp. 8L]